MTLKEKLRTQVTKQLRSGEDHSEDLEQIADEYAIEFAEWIDDLGYVKFPNLWICLEDESGKTSKELLEEFKKEKGL
jgi:predicted DNA-binding protein with PD1-like motif